MLCHAGSLQVSKRQRTIDASLSRTMEMGRALIAQKREELSGVNKSTETGKDLLSIIVKANMAPDLAEHQRMSDEEIIYQISTFLIGGSETTSNALSWLLWHLAQHQGVQQRLREDLSTISSAQPSLEELDKIPLLENCIREALRLESPSPEFLREATEDAVLPLAEPVVLSNGSSITSIPVPKGCWIIQSLLEVHRDKEIWGEDADVFNPDRYERPDCPSTTVPGTYGNLLAFNGGARNCMCAES